MKKTNNLPFEIRKKGTSNEELASSLADMATNVKVWGAKGDGTTDDTVAIQNAINSITKGVVFFPKGTYNISATLTINSGIMLKGDGAELKTITNGMDNTVQYNGVDGFSVIGIKFNQNLKGRTSLDIKNCKHFHVENCFFTGYSADYGHYQTDGGIRITDSIVGKIIGNTWEDHGAQYTETLATLNRCLSIQGTISDHITVTGNTLNRVNQGFVVSCGANNVFSGNTLREVHDNSFYILHQVRGITITGNNFDDKFDECIVCSGRNITVSGNNFKDTPNKFIAITSGGVTNLTVTGNTFENDRPSVWVASTSYSVDEVRVSNGNRYRCTVAGTSGTLAPSHTFGTATDGTVTWQFEDVFIDPGVGAGLLVVRNNVGYPPLNNITFNNNVIKGNFGYAVIQLQNVTGFKCENNNFDVLLSNDFDHIIKINTADSGTNSSISIRHNRFRQSGTGTSIYAIRLENESLLNSTVEGNNTVDNSCRIAVNSSDVLVRNQYMQSAGYYFTSTNSNLEADNMPTIGYFKIGDVVLNRNINESGSNGAKYATYGWRRLTTGNTHVLDVDWRILKLPLGKEDGGFSQFNGTGAATTFTISHTLGVSPSFVSVIPATNDAASDFYITKNASTITVNYKTAPPSGTNNVAFYWSAKG